MYHLNILPYIPLANTRCLRVCIPKNTKVHISTRYRHITHRKHTEPITARSNAALAATSVSPSMLCSKDQLWSGSWDHLDINGPVDQAAQRHNIDIKQTERDRLGDGNRKWEAKEEWYTRKAIIQCACWNALCGMKGINWKGRMCRMFVSQLAPAQVSKCVFCFCVCRRWNNSLWKLRLVRIY